MSILNEILHKKSEHIAAKKAHEPLSTLRNKINDATPPRDFIAALQARAPLSIIAEIKKASPGAGLIRPDFDPVQIAKIYEQCGAACLSVLTDTPYFQGRDEYIAQTKAATALPVLRKDFMIDEYQIYESRALGADCILLIMAALDDSQARDFYEISKSLNMAALIEIHDETELDRALALNSALLGINNRNLKTLEIDLGTSATLTAKIPPGVFTVSESGIKTAADIKTLQFHGYQGFLIGETLMKEPNIAEKFKTLVDTEQEPK